MEYRGVQLAENVKLTKAVKNSLNKLVDKLKEKEYMLLSEYIKSHAYIKAQCKDGHFFNLKPDKFLQRNDGCPKCNDNAVSEYRGIKLHESVRLYMKNGEFDKKIKNGLDKFADNIKKGGFILKGEYVNNSVYIDGVCSKGHEMQILPNTMNDKGIYNCLKCLGICPEQAKKKFYDLVKLEGYILKGEYVKAHGKVEMICNEGHEIEMTPDNFKEGKRCIYCSYHRRGLKLSEECKEEFPLIMKEIGYILLEEYKTANEPIKMICANEHEIEMRPSAIKQGDKCQRCFFDSNIGIFDEESKKKFYDLAEKEGYTVIGEYNGATTPIKMICSENHECDNIRPTNFKNGNRCPICSGVSPIQAKKDFYDLAESMNHKVIGEYVNQRTPVKMICANGHEINPLPTTLKRGLGCAKCSGKCTEQAEEEFYDVLESIGYKIISGEYTKGKEKLCLLCDKGHEFEMNPISIKKGTRCPNCVGSKAEFNRARDKFYKAVKKAGYEALEEYTGNKKKINLKCDKNHIYETTPDRFRISRCPICSESKGEKIICRWLEMNNVEFYRRYKLPNKRWIYDIYIPSKNLIIEVQGIQHYEEVKHFQRTLQDEQENDRKKRQYAKKLGYEYIEVDYRESKPELALKRFLSQFRPKKYKVDQLALF